MIIWVTTFILSNVRGRLFAVWSYFALNNPPIFQRIFASIRTFRKRQICWFLNRLTFSNFKLERHKTRTNCAQTRSWVQQMHVRKLSSSNQLTSQVRFLAPVSRTIFREKLSVFWPVKFKEKTHSLFFFKLVFYYYTYKRNKRAKKIFRVIYTFSCHIHFNICRSKMWQDTSRAFSSSSFFLLEIQY